MRVTIIHPCIGREENQKDYIKTWQMEPLAPAVLAGVTPKGVEIKFYDDRLEEIPYDEKTDLVAMSVETYTAKRCYQIASEYRKRGIPVVMGGFHTTLVPEEVIEYADSICIGEGEEIWPQIIKDLKKNKLKKFYKQIGRADLSKTKPDRSIFKGKRYLKIGLIEAGRGCHFKCEFCAIQAYYNSTQIRRPTKNIIREIKNHDAEIIFFTDDNITSNPIQAKKFFKEITPLKIRWVSQASINVCFDKEFLQIIKDSGCYGLLIGFETLNKKNLKNMNKNFNQMGGGYEEAIKNLRKVGIRLYPTFIFGYPEDNKKTFEEAVKFAKKHKFLITSFNHLTPFPGTPLYTRLEKEGTLLYDKWWLDERYEYGDAPMKGEKLSSKKIREYCINARKSYYSLSSIYNRARDKWNINDIFSFKVFFILNLLFRKEVHQRAGLPLGDQNYSGKLIKANHSDKTTYKQFIQNLKISKKLIDKPSLQMVKT